MVFTRYSGSETAIMIVPHQQERSMQIILQLEY